MKFLTFVKISRPRFWIYILGPFLIGSLFSLDFFVLLSIFFLYFTFPANLLIYGINDIFDYETDKLNNKKIKYEETVHPDARKHLWILIAATNIPFFFFLLFIPFTSVIFFFFFLLCSIEYSAPPLRAKAIPFLDSVFNILYILPGFFAASFSDTFSFPLLISGWLWCMAMHAYSAIPDITADTKAHIHTTATFLGAKGTLIYCLLCYILACLFSFSTLNWFGILLFILYAFMILISFIYIRKIFTLYTFFPYLNTVVGFLLFIFVLFNKL